MKIALIPPIPNLTLAREGDGIHLLLAHLCKEQKYVDFYKERSRKGDYVILDNSAHEHGTGSPMEGLLHLARRLEAHEVVVPDVLFDMRATVESCRRTLRWLVTPEGWAAYEAANRPRLMLVPQGPTMQALILCLRGLLEAWERFVVTAPGLTPPPVVGVSKDYQSYSKGLPWFVSNVLTFYRGNGMYDVHLLGWANDLWATAEVQRLAPWVRSTDSAKPFVYAQAGVRLEPGGRYPEYPRRNEDYFEAKIEDPVVLAAAKANIEVYRAAATDALIT